MELALLGPVLLEEAGALYLDGAGDEADLAALLHQPPDPPVVVELLHGSGETRTSTGTNHIHTSPKQSVKQCDDIWTGTIIKRAVFQNKM